MALGHCLQLIMSTVLRSALMAHSRVFLLQQPVWLMFLVMLRSSEQSKLEQTPRLLVPSSDRMVMRSMVPFLTKVRDLMVIGQLELLQPTRAISRPLIRHQQLLLLSQLAVIPAAVPLESGSAKACLPSTQVRLVSALLYRSFLGTKLPTTLSASKSSTRTVMCSRF